MKKVWKPFMIILVLLFLYMPILILMVYSFTNATPVSYTHLTLPTKVKV